MTLPGDPFEAARRMAWVNKTRAQGPTVSDGIQITRAQAGFLKDTERFKLFVGGRGYPPVVNIGLESLPKLRFIDGWPPKPGVEGQ